MTNQEGKRIDAFLDHKVKDLERRVDRLEFEMDRLLTRRPERPKE